MTIQVASAGPWTVAGVYRMLQQNGSAAGDLAIMGPGLMVKVQDSLPSQTTTTAWQVGGRYTDFRATVYLKGVDSGFSQYLDSVLGHEYGHAWTLRQLFLVQQNDWQAYLRVRGIAGDPRLDTTNTWSPRELIADDYRLLLGSPESVAERPWHLNAEIPPPSQVPGLRDFLLNTWR